MQQLPEVNLLQFPVVDSGDNVPKSTWFGVNVLCGKNVLVSVGLLILFLHDDLKGKKFKHKQDKQI